MRFHGRLSRILVLLLAGPMTVSGTWGEEPATTSAGDQGSAESEKEVPSSVKAKRSSDKVPGDLVPLDPAAPIWIDMKRKRVVMLGEVCLREGQLEMFACTRGTKEHESVLSVPVRAFTVHAGLLAVGAEPGNPARWIPEFAPARGTPIEVTLFWTDEQGKRQRGRAQDWIRQVKSGKPMDQSWVFGGSHLHEDEQTGVKTYLADFGEFICISNFPQAMLDVPVESSDKAGELQFEAFTERIPPRGAKVTLVLTPKPDKEKKETPSLSTP
jgi:hypothetical protein